jgi:hypothetical protein
LLTVTPRRVLGAILVIFTCVALTFNALVPLGEAPDEVSHFAVVRFLAHARRLPTPADGVGGEIFQPPLYYLLAAPLTAWAPPAPLPVVANADFEGDHPWRGRRVLIQTPAARWPWHGEALAWHLARLPSTFYGLLTIVASYGLAHQVFPTKRWWAVGVAAFVAFLPQFTFLSGVLNNDTLATALGAMLLWLLARLVAMADTEFAVGGRWSAVLAIAANGWALVGLLGGLGVWTKSSSWLFVGTTIATALLAGGGWGRVWGRLWRAGAVWAVVGGPWLALNLWRWGDPFGLALLRQVTDARSEPLSLAGWGRLGWETVRSFWVAFGGAAHLHFPGPLNVGLALLALLGLVGAVRLWRAAPPGPTRLVLALCWLHLGLVLLGLVQWANTVLGTGQGRLLFGALPAIALLLVSGWLSLLEEQPRAERRGAFAVLAGGLALMLAAGLLVWRPAYAGPPPPLAPSEAVGWQFEGGLRLEGFAFPWTVDSHLPPGSETELYTEWRAASRTPDLRLRLQLIGRDGQPVWIKEGTPTAGYNTSDQLADWPSPLPGWHRVEIPLGTAPGYYRLILAVVLASGGDPVPITAPDGNALGDHVMVGQLTVVEVDQ